MMKRFSRQEDSTTIESMPAEEETDGTAEESCGDDFFPDYELLRMLESIDIFSEDDKR